MTAPTTDVRLVVLDELTTPGELAAALRLEVGAGQERFVRPPSQTLPAALADPLQVPFAVVTGEDGVVAAAVLDRGTALAELAGVVDVGGAVLLRALLVDAPHQGRGLGTATARAVPALAALLEPAPFAVLLTVNEHNAAGLTAYSRAGFTDAGRHLGGRSGPQRVMRAAVPAP